MYQSPTPSDSSNLYQMSSKSGVYSSLQSPKVTVKRLYFVVPSSLRRHRSGTKPTPNQTRSVSSLRVLCDLLSYFYLLRRFHYSPSLGRNPRSSTKSPGISPRYFVVGVYPRVGSVSVNKGHRECMCDWILDFLSCFHIRKVPLLLVPFDWVVRGFASKRREPVFLGRSPDKDIQFVIPNFRFLLSIQRVCQYCTHREEKHFWILDIVYFTL